MRFCAARKKDVQSRASMPMPENNIKPAVVFAVVSQQSVIFRYFPLLLLTIALILRTQLSHLII